MSAPLRAADADRDGVAATLRAAHAEGRLDASELEERLGRCYAAKTVAELDRLVDDLPRPRARQGPAPRRLPPVLALLALAAVLAAVTHGHAFVVFPLLFFLVLRLGRRRPRWR
ncbi:MAG TPA: DUF1707 domain-containing protein [Gaiellaceae bacterium]|nr:DUF1707 domain-containing protein [Gaiellaceae bacterium]